QIRSALELWSKKNSPNKYKTLLDIVLNSSVCKDTEHNSCWRKLSGDQGVNTGSAVDDQHIKDTNCERLTESNLYRARNKMDEYIPEQQNKENDDDGFMDQNSSVPKDENVQ
ncbi:hypothetical protein BSL78_21185, partial [Apostichopus japonicus]